MEDLKDWWLSTFFVQLCFNWESNIITMTLPMVEATQIYFPIEYLGNFLSRPVGEIMAVVNAFLQFFACLPLPWIRSPLVRKTYATTCGLIIGFYNFGPSFWLIIAYIMLAWVIQRLLPWRIASKTMIATSFLLLFVRSLHGLITGTNLVVTNKNTFMNAFLLIHFVAQNIRDAAILR